MPEPIHVPTAEEVHAACNARIAELEATLREIHGLRRMSEQPADLFWRAMAIARAALPDTEGEQ